MKDPKLTDGIAGRSPNNFIHAEGFRGKNFNLLRVHHPKQAMITLQGMAELRFSNVFDAVSKIETYCDRIYSRLSRSFTARASVKGGPTKGISKIAKCRLLYVEKD